MSEHRYEAVRVTISGRVQGVWYRNWAIGEAKSRGLDGWIRNLGNGTVEALFSGPRTAICQMIAACKDGPMLANVVSIEERSEPALKRGIGFIKRDSL